MSKNVLTMKKEKNVNPEKKIEGFVSNNRKILLIILCAILVIAVAVCVFIGVKDSLTKKSLSAIDSIEYNYTKNSSELSAEEIESRQATVLESLKPYISKFGIVGVRANLLAADVYFSQKDYQNAFDAYKTAGSLSKKSYTSPIANYNAGVCSEELGNLEEAYSFYDKAVSAQDFYLVSHALFSQGRVAESLEKYDDAKKAYNKLVDSYPDDEWTKPAQSRLISLKIQGKID